MILVAAFDLRLDPAAIIEKVIVDTLNYAGRCVTTSTYALKRFNPLSMHCPVNLALDPLRLR